MQQTALQKLSGKRNWALFMLRGMVGCLVYLKRTWPTLHVKTAANALDDIETQLDTEWWDKKCEAMELEHGFLTAQQVAHNEEQQNGNT